MRIHNGGVETRRLLRAQNLVLETECRFDSDRPHHPMLKDQPRHE